MKNMNFKNLKEIVGLAMLGEGIIGFFYPTQYSLFWKIGFEPIEKLKRKAADNPETMRILFAAEASLGFWLAKSQLNISGKQEINVMNKTEV